MERYLHGKRIAALLPNGRILSSSSGVWLLSRCEYDLVFKMMKKNKTIAAWIVGGVVVIAVIYSGWSMLSLFSQLASCVNTVTGTTMSPDNTKKAVVFVEDCGGAVGGEATDLSIINASDTITNNDTRNAMGVVVDNGNEPSPTIIPQWQNSTTLTVYYSPNSEILSEVPEVDGVSLSFTTTTPESALAMDQLADGSQTVTEPVTGIQFTAPFKNPVTVTSSEIGTSTSWIVDVEEKSPAQVGFGFSLGIDQNPSHLTLQQWFEKNVDMNGMLAASDTYEQQILPSGSPALVYANPFPEAYATIVGITPDLYAIRLSSDGKYIVTAALSQDTLSYGTGDEIKQFERVVLQILGTVQFTKNFSGVVYRAPQETVDQYAAQIQEQCGLAQQNLENQSAQTTTNPYALKGFQAVCVQSIILNDEIGTGTISNLAQEYSFTSYWQQAETLSDSDLISALDRGLTRLDESYDLNLAINMAAYENEYQARNLSDADVSTLLATTAQKYGACWGRPSTACSQ